MHSKTNFLLNKLSFIVSLFVVLLAGRAAAQQGVVQVPAGGWHQISPGGESMCARGGGYSFYAHEGTSNRLMIYFQGGGMCWNGSNCSAATPAFDDHINPHDPSDNPAVYPQGFTDFGNPENPFLDYDIMFINYCTADMHTGNSTVEYENEGSRYPIHHKGAVNTATALNWIYANYPAPESVFVAGCSAGAVGAAFWAPEIMGHYGVRGALLADSGGGWRGNLAEKFNLWGTSGVMAGMRWYQGIARSAFTPESFYVTGARSFPGNIFAQYNTVADESQNFFQYVGFSSTPYGDALRANLRDISGRARNFRSYTAWGGLHCILPRGDMYTYQVNGMRLLNWIADLAAGRSVTNITCTDCANPEYFTP